MKRLILTVIVLLALCPKAEAGFFDSAADLASACEFAGTQGRDVIEVASAVACLGYMNGFWHGYYQGGNGAGASDRICWPTNVTPTQLASVYASFFRTNPDRQGDGLIRLVSEAFESAYPCAN